MLRSQQAEAGIHLHLHHRGQFLPKPLHRGRPAALLPPVLLQLVFGDAHEPLPKMGGIAGAQPVEGDQEHLLGHVVHVFEVVQPGGEEPPHE